MLLSYIRIAIRNLRRNRLISFINIFGLGLAMSVGLMELVIVQDALSYDNFHPYPDRTYRIISSYRQNDGQHWKLASTPLPLRDALAADTANIEETVSINPTLQGPATVGGNEFNLRGAFTEPSFFHIFGFTLASGDPQTALGNPGSIILSAATAKRLFGAADPMGKIISFGKKGQYMVTGVLATPSHKSHIDFDAYASGSAILSNDWGDCRATYTYVLTKNTTPLKGLLKSIAAGPNSKDRNGQLSFDTQPITAVSPGSSDIYNEIGRGTSWSKLWTGIDVTLLLLIAACFNYTNLTVARALTRAKEVGVRKINGAQRYQIFLQYIVEACITAFLALCFAWMLFSLIVRYAPFNDGYEMVPSSFRYNIPFVLATIGFALFTGLLAGSAPAWMLSSFRPLRVLRNLTTVKLFGSVGLQKTLIVFQYTLSLVIVIFLSSFYRQFAYLSGKDRGFKKENTVIVPLDGAEKGLVASAFAATSGVRSVSAMSVRFQPRYEGPRGPAWIDNNQKGTINLNYLYADHAFIPSMKIALVAGHNFTSDDSTERSVIINTKASRLLGFTTPAVALGKRLWVNDSTLLTIIGVTSDFVYEGAGRPTDPTAFRNKIANYNYLYITTSSSDKKALTQRLAAAWHRAIPKQPFTGTWLDEDIAGMDSQSATLSLLGYLAFMAVTIATLGLLGLVIYSVETRRKEVSIRKVIGANQSQLVRLLSRRFIRLLVIAGAIGLPIGYTLSFLFQMNFAERPGNGFLAASACYILLLAVGLFTIISQTYAAARKNPAPALKAE